VGNTSLWFGKIPWTPRKLPNLSAKWEFNRPLIGKCFHLNFNHNGVTILRERNRCAEAPVLRKFKRSRRSVNPHSLRFHTRTAHDTPRLRLVPLDVFAASKRIHIHLARRVQLRDAGATPASSLTLGPQGQQSVVCLVGWNLKTDRPVNLFETLVLDPCHSAGTIRCHDDRLGFCFRHTGLRFKLSPSSDSPWQRKVGVANGRATYDGFGLFRFHVRYGDPACNCPSLPPRFDIVVRITLKINL
jgi:hypothetical protein